MGVKHAVRIAVFAVLAVTAVVQFYAWTPDGVSGDELEATASATKSQESALEAAVAADIVNKSGTDSAPQQSVANGWFTNDLLQVAADQNEEVLAAMDTMTTNQVAMFEAQSDSFNRIATVLLLGVLALIWHGATLSWAAGRRERKTKMRFTAPDDLPDPPAGWQGTPPPFTAG
jgi:hypothetical protein